MPTRFSIGVLPEPWSRPAVSPRTSPPTWRAIRDPRARIKKGHTTGPFRELVNPKIAEHRGGIGEPEHTRVGRRDHRVRRRGFIAALAAAATWPLAGDAEESEKVRRVGVLIAFPQSHPLAQDYVAAFRQALGHLGWVEGKNIGLDFRLPLATQLSSKPTGQNWSGSLQT